MKVKKMITLDEIEPTIMIRNPGNRSYTVTSERSGCEEPQTFTSEVYPEEIEAKNIGLTKFPDGRIHPVYMLEVTRKTLKLSGTRGFLNGPQIMNQVCNELIYQKGILLARSVQENDLADVDSDIKSEANYWLASIDANVYEGNPNFIIKSFCNSALTQNYLYHSGKDEVYDDLGLRPIIVLKSRVNIDTEDLSYNWINL